MKTPAEARLAVSPGLIQGASFCMSPTLRAEESSAGARGSSAASKRERRFCASVSGEKRSRVGARPSGERSPAELSSAPRDRPSASPAAGCIPPPKAAAWNAVSMPSLRARVRAGAGWNPRAESFRREAAP